MKLSGTNYPLQKTENLLLIQGYISEKLSLYIFWGGKWPAQQLAAGTGPRSRAGPGKTEKNTAFFLGADPAGPESGISVLVIRVIRVKLG